MSSATSPKKKTGSLKLTISEFEYLALEKCEGSLEQVIQLIVGTDKKLEKLFSKEELTDELLIELIKDSLAGLEFLHSINIVHRDLKPQNILINKCKRAKLSDMGLSRQLRQDEHSFETNASGSWGWQPAEVLRREKRHSSIDVFSMGCIIYYTLTRGKHPFGDRYSRERNILQSKYNVSGLDQKYYEARDLVEKMIAFDHLRRPSVKECRNHILFWSDGKKLSFLEEIVDKIESDILNAPTTSNISYITFSLCIGSGDREYSKGIRFIQSLQ
jgi:serine/threonine-protein kinase/endoribonuclease IRE1